MKVAIVWGRDKEHKTCRTFRNFGEVDAYLQGIADMDGWEKYEIVNEEEVDGYQENKV